MTQCSTSLQSGKRHFIVLVDRPGTAAVLDDNLIAVVHSVDEIPFIKLQVINEAGYRGTQCVILQSSCLFMLSQTLLYASFNF